MLHVTSPPPDEIDATTRSTGALSWKLTVFPSHCASPGVPSTGTGKNPVSATGSFASFVSTREITEPGACMFGPVAAEAESEYDSPVSPLASAGTPTNDSVADV